MFPNYEQSFDIVRKSTQTIVLAPGQSITIIETNNQLPPLATPGTEPTPPHDLRIPGELSQERDHVGITSFSLALLVWLFPGLF